MARAERSVARTVSVFVVLGALVLGAVTFAGFLVIREVATRQALDDAKQLTAISARLVQRRINPGFVSGDAAALQVVDRVVKDAVRIDPIVRVKVWGPDGTILYSDDTAQIGQRFESGREELEELDPGEVVAEVSNLSAPENEGERGFGELLEVYTTIEGPVGERLLFETYQRRQSVADAQQGLLRSFVPVLVVALAAMAVLMAPLAWSLARRLQRDAQERERLLSRAIEASDQERRRIASDLHDGPVQELAGLSMRLAAEAEGASEPAQRRALNETAAAVRGGVRALRTAIVGIYPPNLETAGLGPALSDLTARLPQEGLQVTLEVADPAGYGQRVDDLLYRACREAIRNVERHAGASAVAIHVRRDGGRAVLEVADDGRGIDVRATAPPPDDDGGHFGLRIVGDLVDDVGGRLVVSPGPERGTVVRVEVPIT
ncbi:MAG TPA: ATP-binding protein [Actinomycetota bacterium]